MSYKEALAAFAANSRQLDSFADHKWKQILWNWNDGLKDLTTPLEKDMREIRARLDRLEGKHP